MKYLLQSLLVCGILLLSSSTAFAGQPGGDCAQIGEVTVDCLGQDAQGREQYRVNFQFSWVKAGTNFIRIAESGTAGATYTYPFKTATQSSATGRMYFFESHLRCFNIEVYDVLPNGKVVKCSFQYCVWVDCGEFDPFPCPPFCFGSSAPAGDVPDQSTLSGDVTTGGAAFVALSPNPAADVVDVLVDVPSFDPASSIDIVDLNGRVVASIATGMAAGPMVLPVQLNNLTNGAYLVRMQHADGNVVTPLQVVR